MEVLITFFILAPIMAAIGVLLGIFDQKFSPDKTISFSSPNLDQRLRWMFRIMLGIQIVGGVLAAFLALFFAIAGGGLDLVGTDFLWLYQSCIMLPFVFSLTIITFVNYPSLSGRKWAKWLLIFTIIVNIILAVPLVMVLLVVAMGIFFY